MLLVLTAAATATLLAFMLYEGQLQAQFSDLLNSFTNLVKSAGAGAKVFFLLDREPQKTFGRERPTQCSGEISFENVEFTYPARPLAPVLRNFSLSIKAGEVVAIVGPSGAGKSTIFHLLEHFYEPQVGKVTLDGVEIAKLDHEWLHEQVHIYGSLPVCGFLK